jgi:MFS transporter, UMF1 family
VFLGPYLTEVTLRAAGPDGFVHPFGVPVRAGSFFPYVVSLSVALSVPLMLLFGAVADRTGRKKVILGVFAYLGSAATLGLYFLRGEAYLLGGALFLVANVSASVAIVMYHAYLPEIASADERDEVSSRGWACGYLGGGLLLVINLVLFQAHDALGLSAGDAVRICLASAGAWWAVFTVVPMVTLRDRAVRPPREPHPEHGPAAGGLASGFRQLADTLRDIRAYPLTLGFLAAFLLYNDGIQTVIALSAEYGRHELHLGEQTLIVAILMVQFLAFAGALALGRAARVWGAKRTVLASLVAWTLTISAGYFMPVGNAPLFFLLAVAIGFVLGGSQALSRSLFSQMIPPGKEAEYFSLYEVSDKGTSWLGPLLFGLTLQVTGSYRAAILSLVVFFVAGFLLLSRVPVRRAIQEAGNPVPVRL